MSCAAPAVVEAAREPDDAAPWPWRTRGSSGSPNIPDGGGHDDAAVVLLDHVRPRGAGGVERSADMHGEVALEVVGVGLRESPPTA